MNNKDPSGELLNRKEEHISETGGKVILVIKQQMTNLSSKVLWKVELISDKLYI